MRSFYGSYKRLEFAFGGRHACSLAKAAADVLLLFFISKLAALRLLLEDGAGAKNARPPPIPANKVNDKAFFLTSAGEGRKEGMSSFCREKPCNDFMGVCTRARNAHADSGRLSPAAIRNSSHVWLAV